MSTNNQVNSNKVIHTIWMPGHICLESDSTNDIPVNAANTYNKDSEDWKAGKETLKCILTAMGQL